MRIGVDALSVIPNVVGGSETYICELLRGLLEIDSQNHYVLFVSRTNQARFSDLPRGNLTQVLVPFPSVPRAVRVAGQQLVLPRILQQWELELCLYPGSTMTLRSPCPGVLTIQSLHFLLYPESFSLTRRHYLRYITARSAQRAAAIIVPSEDTRQTAIRLLGVGPQKVFVIPEGIRLDLRPDGGSDLLQRVGLEPRKYIFSPCHFLPYKNLATLVRAFHILRSRYPIPHRLVVAGARVHNGYYLKINSLVRSLGLAKEFIYLGMVPYPQMAAWYRNAAVCVYPSLCETFGLPVLEAMAQGTPVICSDRSALPEVAGKAAILVDPQDPLRLSRAIYQVLSNPIVREMLVEQGLERAKQFSWKRTAQQTLQLFRQVRQSALAEGAHAHEIQPSIAGRAALL